MSARAALLALALGACAPLAGPAGRSGELDGPSRLPLVASEAGMLPPRPPQAPDRPPRPIPLPSITTERLPSGLEWVVVSQRDQPVVAFELLVDAGGLDDRPGVAELAARLVASGAGRPDRGAGVRVSALAESGAEPAVHVGPRHTSFSFTVRRKHLERALQELGELVSRPSLRLAGFTALRAQAMAEASARAGDDPGFLAREILWRQLEGGEPVSRRAVHGTWKELSRIRHAHCDTFYGRHYVAAATMLVVAGDVDAAEVRPLIERAFGSYPSREAPPTPSPPAVSKSGSRIYLVDHPGAPTSFVATIHPVRGRLASAELSAALAERRASASLEGAVRAEARLSGGRSAVAVEAEVARESTLVALHALSGVFETPASEEERTAARRRARAARLAELGQSEALARLARELRAGNEPASAVARHLEELERGELATPLSAAEAVVVVGDAEGLVPVLRAVADVVVVDAYDGFSTLESHAHKPPG